MQSLKNKSLYTGYTTDLKERFGEHNKGLSGFTKRYIPWRLIHYEAYLNPKDAKRCEEYLKTSQGMRMMRIMLKEILGESESSFTARLSGSEIKLK